MGVVRVSSDAIGNHAVPSFSGIAGFSPDSSKSSASGIHFPLPIFGFIFSWGEFFSCWKADLYSSNCIGNVEKTVDQSKNSNINALGNDAVANFAAVADFSSSDSAKSSPFGIILS